MPVFAIVGARLDAAKRRGYVDWQHSVFDGPALVRDFTKWDDTPMSLAHFAESATRAYKFSMTPPYGPTVLAVDQELQEDAIETGGVANVIPKLPQLVATAGRGWRRAGNRATAGRGGASADRRRPRGAHGRRACA